MTSMAEMNRTAQAAEREIQDLRTRTLYLQNRVHELTAQVSHLQARLGKIRNPWWRRLRLRCPWALKQKRP